MTLTKIPGGLIADSTITSTDITDSTITNAKMAVDPANASNLSSGSVPAAQLTLAPDPDLSSQSDDIALLAFKTQANGNLARYNLVDQSVDAFEDASGVNSGASTNDGRNTAGKYYSGVDEVVTALTSGSNAVWNSPASVVGDLKVLVVAGGGGASKDGWTTAGAGGGGVVYISNYQLAASQGYTYTVGAGGAGTTSYAVGSNGDNSVWDAGSVHQTLTAIGGGYGGVSNPTRTTTGGSGGGASVGTGGAATQTASFGPYSNVGFGFAGGSGAANLAGRPAGGGGGAGSVGENYTGAPGYKSGNGGAGKDYSSVFGTSVGDQGWFGGGGGGGGTSSASIGFGNGGDANYGGGGDGGTTSPGATGAAGSANTGGGAGGPTNDRDALAGGSGVIVLKYQTVGNMTLVSNGVTAEAQPTKADVVMTYSMGAGTASVNTDLVASVSRDGGTSYTAVTLASQGTTGGHTILTANSVDISGQPAGTSMVWKIVTTAQALSKQTRIHAVSLGWS